MSWSHVKSIQPMIESFIPHWNLNGIHSLKHPVTVGPTDKSKPKRKINWLVDWLNIGKNKSWNLNRMYPVHENWRSGSGIWVWMYVVLIANQHLATLEWLWTYLSLSLSRVGSFFDSQQKCIRWNAKQMRTECNLIYVRERWTSNVIHRNYNNRRWNLICFWNRTDVSDWGHVGIVSMTRPLATLGRGPTRRPWTVDPLYDSNFHSRKMLKQTVTKNQNRMSLAYCVHFVLQGRVDSIT